MKPYRSHHSDNFGQFFNNLLGNILPKACLDPWDFDLDGDMYPDGWEVAPIEDAGGNEVLDLAASADRHSIGI